MQSSVTSGGEGHPPAVLGQNNSVGLVRLGTAQRLRESVRQLRVQHGQRDPRCRIQRQCQIQGVDAGRFQRNAHLGLGLAQPDQQRSMSAGVVGKLALCQTAVRTNRGHRQRTVAHVDATKYRC